MQNKYEKLNLSVNIISMLFIGLASVLVSYASMKVAENQNKIASTEYQPFFYVSYDYEMKNQRLVQKSINVYNIGAPIANARVQIKEFLAVKQMRNGKDVKDIFPIVGYYFVRNPTGQPKGKLLTAWAHENVRFESLLYDSVSTKEFQEEFGYTGLEIVAAIKIEYQNRLGLSETQYFLNDQLVDSKEYQLFVSSPADSFSKDISKLSVSELLRNLSVRT
ncbi:hypothetical protein [Vibrio mytili]|uniref:Uncharacterized protein n=1 Tax=Vibrio mytili TaxID=50718 RepID=A0A0C3DKM6_9VIBR|nr:hypothetical protein [Vibrio mytili]KIN12014.1 hypothetical protein SU60_04440 [Vibrio mytili]